MEYRRIRGEEKWKSKWTGEQEKGGNEDDAGNSKVRQ
jgi:hypothetical protein